MLHTLARIVTPRTVVVTLALGGSAFAVYALETLARSLGV